MIKITNRNSSKYVAENKEFQANNLSAEFENGAYVVRSYGYYPVFVKVGGQWYQNKSRYSMTTAKQMTQASRDIDRQNAIKLNTNELEKLIKSEPKDPILNSMKAFLLIGDLSTPKEDIKSRVEYKQRIVFATMKNKIPNWEEPRDWQKISDQEKLNRLEKIENLKF